MSEIRKSSESIKKDKTDAKPPTDQVGFSDQKSETKQSLPRLINYQQSKVVNISEDTLRHNRLMSYFNRNFISEQYRIIKTKILEKTREEGLNTILITSAFRGEGKSLTAANLAISLAKEVSHTVLLVDADLKNPSLQQLFGIKIKMGLSDYLLSKIPLSDLFINPGINKLLLLPGHHIIENSAEVAGAPQMERLVQNLKERYPERYVIFDSSPLIETADALILSKYVDGVILVIEAGKTQKSQIEKALRLLENRNLIGLVLNKGEIPERRKYYGYYGIDRSVPQSTLINNSHRTTPQVPAKIKRLSEIFDKFSKNV